MDGSATVSNADATSYKFTGLTKNTNYSARVRAVNAQGESDWSDWSATALVLGPPDAVTGLTLTATDRTLTATWVAPVNDGGSEITDYLVEWKLASASEYSNVLFLDDAILTQRIENLTNGQVYDVQVSAVNAQGVLTTNLATAQGTPNPLPMIGFRFFSNSFPENVGVASEIPVLVDRAPQPTSPSTIRSAAPRPAAITR